MGVSVPPPYHYFLKLLFAVSRRFAWCDEVAGAAGIKDELLYLCWNVSVCLSKKVVLLLLLPPLLSYLYWCKRGGFLF